MIFREYNESLERTKLDRVEAQMLTTEQDESLTIRVPLIDRAIQKNRTRICLYGITQGMGHSLGQFLLFNLGLEPILHLELSSAESFL